MHCKPEVYHCQWLKNIKRTIKAFEMLKKCTGQPEKEDDVKQAFDNFKNIVFFIRIVSLLIFQERSCLTL